MADPFIAEIRIFPLDFSPKDWAFCDGQTVPISQNATLFSLLGTRYGGDGRLTFGLPDLQGNAPIHAGQGPGLSLYDLGQTGGSETAELSERELPNHSHAVLANINPANLAAPSPARSYARSAPGSAYKATTGITTRLSDQAIGRTGVVYNPPHNNMQPYLTLNFCIALRGVYPPRA